MTPIQNKVFKSQEGKERVLSFYNQILSQFPAMQRYVDTIYGKTFVLESGFPGIKINQSRLTIPLLAKVISLKRQKILLC